MRGGNARSRGFRFSRFEDVDILYKIKKIKHLYSSIANELQPIVPTLVELSGATAMSRIAISDMDHVLRPSHKARLSVELEAE